MPTGFDYFGGKQTLIKTFFAGFNVPPAFAYDAAIYILCFQ